LIKTQVQVTEDDKDDAKICDLASIINSGCMSNCLTNFIPGVVITVILSLILSAIHDDYGKWWYFLSPIAGMVSVGVIAFITVWITNEANYRAAFKSRYSVKYAHKVVYRAGMASIFISFSIGLLFILLLLAIFESNFFTFNFNLFSVVC